VDTTGLLRTAKGHLKAKEVELERQRREVAAKRVRSEALQSLQKLHDAMLAWGVQVRWAELKEAREAAARLRAEDKTVKTLEVAAAAINKFEVMKENADKQLADAV